MHCILTVDAYSFFMLLLFDIMLQEQKAYRNILPKANSSAIVFSIL